MAKRSHIVIILLFCLYIGGFFITNLVLPDKDFSPKENRYLQTRPEFSLEKLFSGSFTSDYEAFCSDQFALRDRWIELKAALELGQGKGENNGIFLCEDEFLIDPFNAPPASELSRRAKIVSMLAENLDVPVTMALIPSSAEIYRDLLPNGAENDSQRQVIDRIYTLSGVPTTDIAGSLLLHRDEEIFYHTDHHWTSLGAFYAYEALSDTLGYSSAPLSAMTPTVVSDNFCGTTYSSSGFFWVHPDQIMTFVPEPESLISERYMTSTPVFSELYCEEMLDSKDQYRFFLGGNAPRVVLSTGNEDLPSLLLIRDSYSDSLAPFLLRHFSSIHLLDLRYYRSPISDYVRDNDIDQVCVIYSVKDFCEDGNLALMTQ